MIGARGVFGKVVELVVCCMPDPNKMFAMYSLIGLVAGLVVGGIVSAFLGNYALWLSVVPTIGILIALLIFQRNKDKFGL